MTDEREQVRLRECEAMGHVWPKRPTCGVFRNRPKPAGWRDLFEHAEWVEACERCGKQAEVSVFLCEAEGVELLRSEAKVGVLVSRSHHPLARPSRAPHGLVHKLGPMKVVMRWGLVSVPFEGLSDRG